MSGRAFRGLPLCAALSLLPSFVMGGESDVTERQDHLSAHSTIGDILRHPSFAGFAPLILPAIHTWRLQ